MWLKMDFSVWTEIQMFLNVLTSVVVLAALMNLAKLPPHERASSMTTTMKTESPTTSATTLTTTTATSQITTSNADRPSFNIGDYSKLVIGLGYGDNWMIINRFEVIDLKNENATCSAMPSYPVKFASPMAGLDVDNVPLVCGGVDKNYICRTECYKLNGSAWSLALQYLPHKMCNGYSYFSPENVAAGRIIYAGGSADKFIEYWTPRGWRGVVTYTGAYTMMDNCITAINSTTFFLLKGYTEQSDFETTYIFSIETDFLHRGPPLTQPRTRASCSRMRNPASGSYDLIVVTGGQDASGNSLNTTEILDLTTMKWRPGPDLPAKLYASTMVEHHDQGVVLIGGADESEAAVAELYHLATESNGWNLMKQEMATRRFFPTAFPVPASFASCT